MIYERNLSPGESIFHEGISGDVLRRCAHRAEISFHFGGALVAQVGRGKASSLEKNEARSIWCARFSSDFAPCSLRPLTTGAQSFRARAIDNTRNAIECFPPSPPRQCAQSTRFAPTDANISVQLVRLKF